MTAWNAPGERGVLGRGNNALVPSIRFTKRTGTPHEGHPHCPRGDPDGPSMLGSSAFEYAVRALTYLAQREGGGLVKLREIADAEGIPAPFLSNVLNRLVATGLLRSVRGPTGGYALTGTAEELRLLDVREVMDGLADLDRCAVGLPQCSAVAPCAMHHRWVPVRARIHAFLSRTTIGDLAHGRSEGEEDRGSGPAEAATTTGSVTP